MIIIKDCGFKASFPFEVVLARVVVDGNYDITQLVKEVENEIEFERKSDDDLNKLPYCRSS